MFRDSVVTVAAVGAALGALVCFRLSEFSNLLSGQKIDGTQE